MAKIVAVVNQKGGVGKTTTSINLSASLAFYSQRVLLVDLDPQGNASSGLGVDKSALSASIYDVLINRKPIAEVIQNTTVGGLSLAPSHIDLIGVEVELIQEEGRGQILKRQLESVIDQYDFIILDCPPSLGILTLNALCAAQSVLIPIQCEFYALEGISQLVDTIERVQGVFNPTLKIEGVLLTMFDSRIKLANDVMGEIRKVFSSQVYQTVIPRNVRLAESPSFGKPVFVHDFPSRGAQAYFQLAQEFLQRNGVAVAPDGPQQTSNTLQQAKENSGDSNSQNPANPASQNSESNVVQGV